jgi:hypothetical protein
MPTSLQKMTTPSSEQPQAQQLSEYDEEGAQIKRHQEALHRCLIRIVMAMRVLDFISSYKN